MAEGGGGAAPEAVLLLRTNYCDADLVEAAHALRRESGLPVCFVADETRSPVHVPDEFPKVAVTEAGLEALGLHVCPDVMWRCGDYCFYAAAPRFPAARFFWIIEPDVRLNFASARDFFAPYGQHRAFDLLAPQYSPETEWPNWQWGEVMRHFAEPVQHCLYPLLRLSRPAIEFLLSRRRALAEIFRERAEAGQPFHPDLWPNDEAFTATELTRAGFRCADLNAFGREVHNGVTFSPGGTRLVSQFRRLEVDEHLYHPVLDATRFLRKHRSVFDYFCRIETSPADLRRMFLDAELLADLRRECPPAELASYEDQVGRVIAERESRNAAAVRPTPREERNMGSVRADLIARLWRGNDPFAGFPDGLFEFDIQGWQSQHPYLTEAMDTVRPRVVVEIGVWKGGSTLTMAARLRELGLDAVVIAVDTWLGAWDHWIDDGLFQQLGFMQGTPMLSRKFMGNVVRLGLQDHVVPLPLDSVNAAHVLRHFRIRPDVIHIDGGHDKRAVLADLAEWWPELREDGILIGDDYRTDGGWPGVRAAFDEFFAPLGLVPIENDAAKCRIRKPAAEEAQDMAEEDETLREARRAAMAAPGNPHFQARLGDLLSERGRIEEAEAAYRAAVVLAPSTGAFHIGHSHLLARLNRTEEALAAAQRALQLGLRDAHLHAHIGHLLVWRGDLRAAEAYFRRAIDLDPSVPAFHAALSDVMARLQQHA